MRFPAQRRITVFFFPLIPPHPLIQTDVLRRNDPLFFTKSQSSGKIFFKNTKKSRNTSAFFSSSIYKCKSQQLLQKRLEKMKKRKLNRILILITIIALLLPAGTAYASDIDEGTAEPQTIGNYTVSFVAKSDVTADVILFAASIGIPSYITSKITLQSASLGSSVYTNVSGIQPSILYSL